MIATGGGKVILFGEHFVLSGLRGVAAPIPDAARARARPDVTPSLSARGPDGRPLFDTRDDPSAPPALAWAALLGALGPAPPLRVEVELRLPPGAGLGSSAALAAAAARAALPFVDSPDDPAAVRRATDASEAVFHGDASGIDAAAAAAHTPLTFRRGPPPEIAALRLSAPLHLVIGLAAPGRATAAMIAHARARRALDPALFGALDDAYAALARRAPGAIERGELAVVGDLMNTNHALLIALGVSAPALERERAAALEAGALGAKLTGAGGGGALIALATDRAHASRIAALWTERGAPYTLPLTLEPAQRESL